MDAKDLDNRFDYHKPKTEQRADDHQRVRKMSRMLAGFLEDILPEGREKSIAITKLEEVMFWANASLARNDEENGSS